MASEDRIDAVTAFLWTAFSLGGFVAAFLAPVHILLTHLAVPLGLLPASAGSPAAVLARMDSILVRLYVVVFVAGTLWHGVYRFKYLLYDAGLRRYGTVLSALLHGVALVGTLAVLWVVLRLG